MRRNCNHHDLGLYESPDMLSVNLESGNNTLCTSPAGVNSENFDNLEEFDNWEKQS